MKKLPIGISDFKKLQENNYYFVDSSNFINDIYSDASDILLITRPRRFGKTLNMSMLQYFFNNKLNSRSLFEGLKISQNGELMEQINTYLTVFISFKDIKDNSWENAYGNLKVQVSELYKSFEKELSDFLVNENELNYFNRIINLTADSVLFRQSLKKLIEYLRKFYDKPVLLLVDECDVPIQSGWNYGCYEDVIDFMRVFLSSGLKDNPNLFKGIMTGIYRVA